MPAKKPKYGNRKVRYMGLEFDSHREMRRWIVLSDMLKKGEIRDLQRQVPFQLIGAGDTPLVGDSGRKLKYVADFTYLDREGDLVVEDPKGFKTPEYLLKKAILRAQGIIVREV